MRRIAHILRVNTLFPISHKYVSEVVSVLSLVLAILLALIIGAVLIELSEISSIEAFQVLIKGAFGDINGISETVVKATPLILAGLGTSIAFKANIFNIGAEGQIYLGALGGAFVGLFLGNIPPIIGIPLSLTVGFILGALWAGVAALLSVRFEVSEVIVTLMQNYIAILLTNYLVKGPWKAERTTVPISAILNGGAFLPNLLANTRLHAGALVAVLAALLVWFVVKRTVFGYRVVATGLSKKAAEYGGINTRQIFFMTMLISGGLSGLAGVSEINGLHHRLVMHFSPGFGYTAIAIAMLGGLNPPGIVVASILFSALLVGADAMQRILGVPLEIIYIMQGVILLFVLGSSFLRSQISKLEMVGE